MESQPVGGPPNPRNADMAHLAGPEDLKSKAGIIESCQHSTHGKYREGNGQKPQYGWNHSGSGGCGAREPSVSGKGPGVYLRAEGRKQHEIATIQADCGKIFVSKDQVVPDVLIQRVQKPVV
ncbi:hypothetical protein MUG91_G35n132 [Manis pentadactyla]|nr:hypothetical protein MUG91_G35n132 [Manis pentadactyla]